ncbi:MAG: GtrA family protein [Dehalococcoidia bacterium]
MMGLSRFAAAQESAALLLRFGLVGIVKATLDFGTFNLVLLVSPADSRTIVLVANTAGFGVAMSASFLLAARYIFRVVPRRERVWRYVAVSIGGLALYDGALALILGVSGPNGIVEVNVAKAGALAASASWTFIGYRYLVFQPHAQRARVRTV